MPVYTYRRGWGSLLACSAVKHYLKRGQQQGLVYGFTTNITKVLQHPLMAMITMKANIQ